ncbi:MAG: phosphoadenosine phosphosulfate reductase family protein [Cyclobacteriaceae bacterium]
MSELKHVLGISGGKDSAALAIYMRQKYPQLDILYYFCDTGKELDETYKLIESLKSYLGKDIVELKSDEAAKSGEDPFDFYYKAYRGYLPSSVARWCTKKMKLEPFEKFVGTDPVISYVGIRGDEDREGYISTKKNIQSIFPFRRNIWSEDVINQVLDNKNRSVLADSYSDHVKGKALDKVESIVSELLELRDRSYDYNRKLVQDKLTRLLDCGVVEFNHAVFDLLKNTEYPLANEDDFPMLDNEDSLNRDHIFELLETSGVGVPAYYNKIGFDLDGQKGDYARSRSGCYFCFFQQKIEWIWLYEQHPDLFTKAIKYENEKEGFTWNQDESLLDIIKPNRLEQIKIEHIARTKNRNSGGSKYLINILDGPDTSCIACFT